MEVTVVVPTEPAAAAAERAAGGSNAAESGEIMDEIAALPDENPGDTFSGADHDKVLYGAP